MTKSSGTARMKVGTGKAVITPPLGTLMAGYGHRDHGAEGVLDDLELRAFWLEADQTLCIVTADLIGFGEELTAEIRSDLSERFGIEPEAVLLAASHTHSGPQTAASLAAAGGLPVPEYTASLRQKIMQAVQTAKETAQPVTLHGGRGVLEDGFAINRRRKENGNVLNAPNPPGVKDDEVITIFARNSGGEVIAIWYYFTCHPTTMGDYRITGDYPGAARRHIEGAIPGAAAGFLPGCFGDIRPNCTILGSRRFRRGTPEDVAAFGTALGSEVARIVASTGTIEYEPRFFTKAREMKLPFATTTGEATLSIQRLDLAANLTIVAMGGEICVDFGHFIKGIRPDDTLIPLGYSNGLVGYIASARLFPEGGYEADSSHKVYGLPAPFHPSIDGIVRDQIEKILE